MAQGGVLPFVRGIDFTKYDFEDDDCCPRLLSEMQRLRWLRLNRTGLKNLPQDIADLTKIEQLHVNRNKIESLDDDLASLSCLRVLNARRNQLTSQNISSKIFNLEELAVLDLSHNKLHEIPVNLDEAKSISVLNLSHNSIKIVPQQLFISLTDLVYLDLSSNNIESLPPQIRRLVNLKTLMLDNNPMFIYQMRQLPVLVSLETLSMKNTQRNLNNIPMGLENLPNLKELNFSCNQLPSIHESIYKIKKLQRLDLSSNQIKEISPLIDNLEELGTLNLSRNELRSLPNSICKLSKLKKLYVNSNKLKFEGIPAHIGQLGELEVFSASDNLLEMLPEGLCRCGKLRKVFLNKNRLYTLPDAIHFLQLQELDVHENPDFKMPAKPVEIQKRANAMYYNVDFSLQHQLQLAGAIPASQTAKKDVTRDPVARKKRLKLLKQNVNEKESSKVLKGMQDSAGTTSKKSNDFQMRTNEESALIKGKRWDEQLEKPKLDYSEFFEDDSGHIPGIVCYEIDKFLPHIVDGSRIGKFHEGDCYVVLKTYIDQSNSLNWQIYFWIGAYATLDKQACAAMHAVNLRNLLGATCRTIREEQNDESDEFMDLFDGNIEYLADSNTSSGFYTVEDIEYVTRFYRVSGTHRLLIKPVEQHYDSLDPRFVFLLDDGLKIYLWNGAKCNPITRSKARLFAEKINKNERKFQAEIIQMKQADELPVFWKLLGGPPETIANDFEYKEHDANVDDPTNVTSHKCKSYKMPKLYKVGIGMGYLELPQVEVPLSGTLTRQLLDSKSVYILDCYEDIFVWIGRKSTRLVRTAALKLSCSLQEMIHRPDYALVTSTLEGTETQVFKSKFDGWDDSIAVDYTRSAESVSKRGADIRKILSETEFRTDLVALFIDRYTPISDEDALAMMDEMNEFLDSMQCFVFENKRFVRLPEHEYGQFYSEDSYLFVCRYWKLDEDQDDQASMDQDDQDNVAYDYECKIYFWQGREANNAGWLTFTLNMKKTFGNIEIIKLNQQQECQEFLAHFKRKFVVHNGKRNVNSDAKCTRMYQIRRNPHSAICTRCIEVEARAETLCSQFCYIVCVPFENTAGDDTKGIVYVWLGSMADSDEIKLAEEIAMYMYDDSYSIQVLNEGEEPDTFFWYGLGGKREYERTAVYMKHMRLFRCSNERGYFAVTEKFIDFCQDDLSDDDIMILDTGTLVYLWIGPTSTDIEKKFAARSAQLYIQHMKNKQPDVTRKLLLTTKGREPPSFTKCFHGWSKYKSLALNLEKKIIPRMIE